MDDLRQRLERSLSQLDHQVETEWEATPAAVLVPLYLEHGEWKLLFTRRTDSVDVHSGQVSFPGGRIENADASAADAALREAEEEIGLKRQHVEILGQLNPLLTVTQFLVTPLVGIFPWPYDFEANPSEVARYFGVPVKWLANPDNLEIREREPFIPGKKVLVYYFSLYEGELIWGVTARITVEFLKLLGSTRDDR